MPGPVLVIQGKDRSVAQEMELLCRFADGADSLQFTRSALLDAARVAVREKRYSSDGFQRAWKNHFDDAARLFKKQYGWTPLADARELAARAMSVASRYTVQEKT